MAYYPWNNKSTNLYGDLNETIQRIGSVLIEPFIPRPEDIDYEKGYIPRYFIAKNWDPRKIAEVSVESYDNDFPNLNPGSYNRIEILWFISGNINSYILSGGKKEGILTKNKKAIDEAKETVPGIILLKNNLLQFYKSENLYTNGGEYTLNQYVPDPSYIGYYHIAAGIGPMVGAHHDPEVTHAQLYPTDGSNPKAISDAIGKIY